MLGKEDETHEEGEVKADMKCHKCTMYSFKLMHLTS